jgi:hypothetical protein
MRQLPFVILLALAVSLGGCASSPTVGVCARVSDFAPRQEFALPLHRKKPLRRAAVSHSRALDQVAVLPQLSTGDTAEPRFTSPEWWLRENARLGKAIIICRGCLPVTTANTSLPKPAVLSSKSDLQAIPTGSMNRLEGSIGVETPDQP